MEDFGKGTIPTNNSFYYVYSFFQSYSSGLVYSYLYLEVLDRFIYIKKKKLMIHLSYFVICIYIELIRNVYSQMNRLYFFLVRERKHI